MSNEDLQQLKALAEKIKSGDYSIDECNKFIDVSGPDAILALIERIESLAAPAVANGAEELPPLPAPEFREEQSWKGTAFTADQMHAYARAALASVPTAPEAT